jgi:hypothetical protein
MGGPGTAYVCVVRVAARMARSCLAPPPPHSPQSVAEDVGFMAPPDDRLDFALRLFDLNQDGRVSTDEMLSSLALDGAVGEEGLDADVLAVFDKVLAVHGSAPRAPLSATPAASTRPLRAARVIGT